MAKSELEQVPLSGAGTTITDHLTFQPLPRRQVALTMAGVMLAMFLASLDQTVVGTAMPRIIADLGGFAYYAWVTTAYLVASTTLVPIIGRLTDMYGRKWFFIGGIIIFLLGSVLSGLSQSIIQLIIFRGFQGIGAGVIMASAFITVGDLFSPDQRGKYQGLIAGVFGLSSVIGPTLGGYLTDAISWHWVFYINIPLGIPVVALFILFFPESRRAGIKHRLDFLGVATLTLAVVPLLLALSWGGAQYPWDSVEVIGTLAFAAVMTVLFIFTEFRASEPIIPVQLFRNQLVAVAMILTFLTGFSMFGVIIFIPLFFQGVLGMSATASGGFLTPMTLGMVVGSVVSGQVSSRAGGHYRILGLVGVGLMALGLALLSRMTVDTGYGQAVLFTVLMGLGLGSTMPLFTLAVQNTVQHQFLGVATSTLQFFRSIGGTLGLAILGSVMTNRFASALSDAIPADIKAVVPPERLTQLAHNPQALMNPDAQAQLGAGFSQIGPQGAAMAQQLLDGLRSALSIAITEAFLLAFAVGIVAWIAAGFLKVAASERTGRGPGQS